MDERLRERLLVALLRLGGVTMLLAFGAVVMPTAWMASNHARLGLGEFPASPLVEYLTRSISLLYGFHGGLLLVVSRDVRRHVGIVRFLGFMNLLFGVAFVGIDLHAGMPLYWTLAEGPPVFGFGLILLYLVRGLESSCNDRSRWCCSSSPPAPRPRGPTRSRSPRINVIPPRPN